MHRRSGFVVCAFVALAALVAGGCGLSGSRVNRTDGARMVWVPAGEFLMGSTDEDIARAGAGNAALTSAFAAAETPRKQVYLDGYWIYRNEVTVAQYRKFCNATGRTMPDKPDWGWADDHPIVNVSWEEASAYAAWAGCSLPTEAQWEKAARGTDGRTYPWGEDWPPKTPVANLPDRTLADKAPELAGWADVPYPVLTTYADGYAHASPVGSFREGASPFGCMDMAGNVWEWCADRYAKGYYRTAPSENPAGPPTGGTRVLRGGSWLNDDEGAFRCANRDHFYPDYRQFNYGFRCVRNP